MCGRRYDDFIEKYITSTRKDYPRALLHFVSPFLFIGTLLFRSLTPLKEDFGLSNARRIIDQYRDKVPMFNDGVQGTGCVTLAALMAGLHIIRTPMKGLRVLCFGAGSGALGSLFRSHKPLLSNRISHSTMLINRYGMTLPRGALPNQRLTLMLRCVDKPGLLLKSKKDQFTTAQIPYARDNEELGDKPHENLYDIVKEVKPHVLFGTSTKPGASTEEVVEDMASHVDRPVIFPLSNPTRLHEAQPLDIGNEGRALIATGSPFPPIEYNGTKYEVAECNNSTVSCGTKGSTHLTGSCTPYGSGA